MAVPAIWVPSTVNLITALGSAVPVRAPVVLLVPPPTSASVTTGAAVSRVKVLLTLPVWPLALVSLATTVCWPSLRPVGV